MRIEELLSDFHAEKKTVIEQTSQVTIYDPTKPLKIERKAGDERVLFFIPDNGRDTTVSNNGLSNKR